MQLVVVEVLANLLQVGHPRRSQVAVLENDPNSRVLCLVDGLFGLLPLALPQRNHNEVDMPELGEGLQRNKRIVARKNENNRSLGILEGGLKTERRRPHVLLAHLLPNEIAYRLIELIIFDRLY